MVQGQVGHLLADHPADLIEALAAGGAEAAGLRGDEPMKKIDVAAIEAARRG